MNIYTNRHFFKSFFVKGSIVLILFASIVSLNSCGPKENKCEESKTTAKDLEAFTLSKLPYSGYDTLYFLNKLGDTCVVRGTGKQFYYTRETEFVREPACEQDYVNTQGCKIHYTSLKGNLHFYLDLENRNTLNINLPDFGYEFHFIPSEIGIVGSVADPEYVGLFTVNNISYDTVWKAYLHKTHGTESPDGYSAYYNKTNGILKMSSIDEEFSLIK